MAVLKVGADGKAPAGAKIGDTIKTAGGDYKITGGTAGNWTSTKVTAPTTTAAPKPAAVTPYIIGSEKGMQIADNLSAGQTYQASDGSTWVKNQDGTVSVTTKNGTFTKNAYQSQAPVVQQVPTPQAAYTDPKLMGKSIGDLYGLTYDYGTILDLLNKATGASYDAQKKEFQTTENQFYRNMVGSQEDTLNILRENQAKAVATGASKGIAAANELSAILNLQDVAGQGASDLASQRNLLMDKERAAYEKNASDALNTSNSIKTAIAGLDLSKYGYDVQEVIGKLNTIASMYSADQTLKGVQYNADQNLAGTIAANKFTGNYGSGGYYGGNTGGSPTGSTPSTGGKTSGSIDAKTAEVNAFIGDKNVTSYAPPGANIVFYKTAGGSYVVKDTTGKVLYPDATADDIRKIVKNNNDPTAVNPGYGESEFNRLMDVINGGTAGVQGTNGSRLQTELGEGITTNTPAKVGNTVLTSGTKLTYQNRAGTGTFTFTYDAAAGVWKSASGNLSVAEMNKRLANGELYNLKVTKP